MKGANTPSLRIIALDALPREDMGQVVEGTGAIMPSHSTFSSLLAREHLDLSSLAPLMVDNMQVYTLSIELFPALKSNVCVVGSQAKNNLRQNGIKHEYWRGIPPIMKDYQGGVMLSLDVLRLKEKYGLGLDLLQKAGNQLKILPQRLGVDFLKERDAAFVKSRYIVHAELDSACELNDFFRLNCVFAKEHRSYWPIYKDPATALNLLRYRAVKGFINSSPPSTSPPLPATSPPCSSPPQAARPHLGPDREGYDREGRDHEVHDLVLVQIPENFLGVFPQFFVRTFP